MFRRGGGRYGSFGGFMKLFSRSLAALCAATVLAGAANAASTVTYTSNFGPTGTEFTATGSLQGFDGSLGTLTGVLITYDIAADMVGTGRYYKEK